VFGWSSKNVHKEKQIKTLLKWFYSFKTTLELAWHYELLIITTTVGIVSSIISG